MPLLLPFAIAVVIAVAVAVAIVCSLVCHPAGDLRLLPLPLSLPLPLPVLLFVIPQNLLLHLPLRYSEALASRLKPLHSAEGRSEGKAEATKYCLCCCNCPLSLRLRFFAFWFVIPQGSAVAFALEIERGFSLASKPNPQAPSTLPKAGAKGEAEATTYCLRRCLSSSNRPNPVNPQTHQNPRQTRTFALRTSYLPPVRIELEIKKPRQTPGLSH
jgi:hypothetical protein